MFLRSLLALAAAAVLAPSLPAIAHAAGEASVQVVVETVPPIEGVRFDLDGERFQSGRDGVAKITAPRTKSHRLEVMDRTVRRPRLRASFVRWDDPVFSPIRSLSVAAVSRVRLQVGFDVSYLVQEGFVDEQGRPVDPGAIDGVTFTDRGGRVSVEPDRPIWVSGTRVVRGPDGLQTESLPHAVESVTAGGTNVVNVGQQVFFADRETMWQIQVLFYDLQLKVRDRFFGFPIGSTLSLESPDGHVRRYRLSSTATLTIRSLPRGDYRVTVHGRGLPLEAPIALSRDQSEQLVFLSVYDLGAVGAIVLLFLVGLALIGRRKLRKRNRSAAIVSTDPLELATLLRAGGRQD